MKKETKETLIALLVVATLVGLLTLASFYLVEAKAFRP